MANPQKFETVQLHGGQEVDAATNSRAVPIYATTVGSPKTTPCERGK